MESLITQPGASASRRDFFKRAGLGVGVLASAAALQACDSNDENSDADVVLDFSSDVGVLNYAYALEQLEAAFYAQVIANSAFTTIFSGTAGPNGGPSEQAIFRSIAAHEAVHADFFKQALTAVAPSQIIPGLTVDFSSIDFGSKTNVLAVSQTFEDLGVTAYDGAGKYLSNKDYLTVAGKIVSVEARHASIISGLISKNSVAGAGQIDPANGLNISNTPQAVLAAASTYIKESIGVTNT